MILYYPTKFHVIVTLHAVGKYFSKLNLPRRQSQNPGGIYSSVLAIRNVSLFMGMVFRPLVNLVNNMLYELLGSAGLVRDWA